MKERSPRNQPTQIRSQKRVELILATAHQLFLEHGVEETTTNDIAAAAGIPIGSIYRYYRNKNEIISALNARYVHDIGDIMDDIERNSLLGELSYEQITETLLTNWLAYCQSRQPYTALLFQRASPALQKQSHVLEYELFGSFVSLVAEIRKTHGRPEATDPLETANLLILYKSFGGAIETIYELRDEDMAVQVFGCCLKLLATQLEQNLR